MTCCALCQQEVFEPKKAWKQMVGWVSPHGSKAMTQTHPTGAVAHAECIVALKQGVSVTQERLI